MPKAKSRLSTSTPIKDPIKAKYSNFDDKTIKPFSQKSTTSNSKSQISNPHLSKLPTLIISFPFLYIVIKILSSIYPDQVQNLILTNSYFPLIASLFFGLFFLLSFIFLNSKRALIIATFIVITFYFRLINVIFTPILLLVLIIPALFLLLVTFLPSKKINK